MAKSASDPGWELYRSFLAVLREGSLSAAARALGLTQPTIGRHVDALEAAVGFALFTRSQHGFLPTEAALSLQPYAETLATTTAALLRAASAHAGSADQLSGTVRITASDVVGAELLPPILTALRQAHPQLVIELALSNRLEDLLQREADIAIRMLRPTQEALLTRRVGSIELGLYGHEDYLARHGIPQDMAQLLTHSLIGFDRGNAYTRSAALALGGLQRAHFALRTDHDLAQLALLRAGYGIGFCQVPLARRTVQLQRILPQQFTLQLDTWVVMHEDLRSSARCRVTFDALVTGLQRYMGS